MSAATTARITDRRHANQSRRQAQAAERTNMHRTLKPGDRVTATFTTNTGTITADQPPKPSFVGVLWSTGDFGFANRANLTKETQHG